MQSNYPILRPIADTGVLVEFGAAISELNHQAVLQFDAAVSSADIPGLTETSPAYTSVLVGYNPLLTDYDTICQALQSCLGKASESQSNNTKHWQIPACYSEVYAPDLAELADKLSVSEQDVIAQHVAAQYKVYMYGFAPGYAYLGGVPEAIQIPRKQAPVMGVPAGVIMIAGPQALITTVVMPTGWWRIGRSGINPLQSNADNPFLFNVGDTVEFVAMSETDFKKHATQ